MNNHNMYKDRKYVIRSKSEWIRSHQYKSIHTLLHSIRVLIVLRVFSLTENNKTNKKPPRQHLTIQIKANVVLRVFPRCKRRL